MVTPVRNLYLHNKRNYGRNTRNALVKKEKQLARDIAMKTMDINVFMVEVLGVKKATGITNSLSYACHLS